MITILKEINQTLKEILAELKEPTVVTVDFEKLSNTLTTEQKIRRLSGQ
ncbi:hypothetical protein [Streptococcus agalactiae]|nr:hypothetical protein [Streptococcus agalactiae]HEN6804882.1 hypothetical protein [Streptococcus agalactiae]HEN6832400.1 hypothetical protein [Streptococcus agalactiae]HEN6978922.1 hypothetical protein [Streptococcus agalactiae]HEO0308097.1 hypothetical protein [Streptococcus agalactiae]HEO1121695.1 hypothetical protein [Streptococcus agalactiae]